MIISRALRQTTDVLRRIKQHISDNELLRTVKLSETTWTKTEIEFPNGSRILSLPPSKDTIRGIPANLIIIDEAAHFPNDEVYFEAISPMAVPGTKLILISTPYGQRGFFYECFHNEGVFKSILHKAIEDGKPIWAESRPLDWLEEKKAEIGDRAFEQEYMCSWLSVKNAYFPYEAIEKSVANFEKCNFDLVETDAVYKGYRPPRGEYYCGVDWAKSLHTGDKTVIYVVELLPNSQIRVVLSQVYSPKDVQQASFLYTQACTYIEQLHHIFEFKRVYADLGAGAKQVEDLKLAHIPVDGIAFGAASSFDAKTNHKRIVKMDMMDYLLKQFEDELIYIPDRQDLLRELFEFEITTYNEEGRPLAVPRLSHPPGGHDDHVAALALAVYATRKPRPTFAVASFRR
jgi:phage FluMu gp28-like protein